MKKSKIIFIGNIIFSISMFSNARADIAGTSYIRGYILQNYGVNLPDYGSAIASEKYLMKSIDLANKNLNGIATNYESSVSNNVVAKTAAYAALSTKIKHCLGGTYFNNNDCLDCGVGYYCAGGSMRSSCTYGAVTCSGTNHSYDPPKPADMTANSKMTLDQVQQWVPVTKFSQWHLISCCSAHEGNDKNINNVNDVDIGCATGTLTPGVYMFSERYVGGSCADTSNPIDGQLGCISAEIAVFDHSVSYKSVHANSVFNNFVDANNAIFTSWTIIFPNIRWNLNINQTNIDFGQILPNHGLCVYMLK